MVKRYSRKPTKRQRKSTKRQYKVSKKRTRKNSRKRSKKNLKKFSRKRSKQNLKKKIVLGGKTIEGIKEEEEYYANLDPTLALLNASRRDAMNEFYANLTFTFLLKDLPKKETLKLTINENEHIDDIIQSLVEKNPDLSVLIKNQNFDYSNFYTIKDLKLDLAILVEGFSQGNKIYKKDRNTGEYEEILLVEINIPRLVIINYEENHYEGIRLEDLRRAFPQDFPNSGDLTAFVNLNSINSKCPIFRINENLVRRTISIDGGIKIFLSDKNVDLADFSRGSQRESFDIEERPYDLYPVFYYETKEDKPWQELLNDIKKKNSYYEKLRSFTQKNIMSLIDRDKIKEFEEIENILKVSSSDRASDSETLSALEETKKNMEKEIEEKVFTFLEDKKEEIEKMKDTLKEERETKKFFEEKMPNMSFFL